MKWIIAFLFFALFGQAHAADLAVGDSIALGAGRALGVPTRAREGVGSCWVKNAFPGGAFDHVVISVGINDAPGMCAGPLRWQIKSAHVVWILPAPINSAREHIANVAASFGDRTISYQCRGGCSSSNFHPASYQVVAQWVMNAWGLPTKSVRSARRRANIAR